MNGPYCRILLLVFASLSLAFVEVTCSKAKPDEHRPPKSNTVVLKYSDFGPQVVVHEVLGMEWYQWNSQGPDDPNESDDIKVVVYRNIPLDEVKRKFPVIKEKQDYRYLEYGNALKLLNDYELDPSFKDFPEMKLKAKQTKERILEQLGT